MPTRRLLSLSKALQLFGGSARSIWKTGPRVLAALFTQAALAFAVLSYPLLLQFGAYVPEPGHPSAKEQFDFCQGLPAEPKQSCSVTTRFFIREIEAAAGDPRACLQAAATSKVLFHPWKRENWDRVSLIGYASYYWEDERLSKRIKARIAQFMLDRHRQLDARCDQLHGTPADSGASKHYAGREPG